MHSLDTFIGRPIFALISSKQIKFFLAKLIYSFFPIIKPVFCGPLTPFPPLKETSDAPALVNLYKFSKGGNFAEASTITGISLRFATSTTSLKSTFFSRKVASTYAIATVYLFIFFDRSIGSSYSINFAPVASKDVS